MLGWILDWFSSGHDVTELASRVDLSVDQLKSLDLSYHRFSVAKKSGRQRQICAPNDQLKSVQRRLLRRLFAKLRSHPLATGFQKGVSFADNAKIHQSQAIVVRFDLIDFFPSIHRRKINKYFRSIGWNRQAARLLTDLTTHEDRLPQGAPTSPRLSNLVNFRLDTALDSIAADHNAMYSRYADDITFSMSNPNADVHELISDAMRVIRSNGYRPHIKRKFDVRRQHQRQVVTGLVVNESARLPRERRRWLRAVEHRLKLQEAGVPLSAPPTISRQQLEGWKALQKMIDSSES